MARNRTEPDSSEESHKGLPILRCATSAEWESWLDTHHGTHGGVWLCIAKKDGTGSSPTYDEALKAALCFGWIDGQKGRLDETFWIQRFTPRTPRSPWSKRNISLAEALMASGRMRERGRAEIERARTDGRWAAAYDSQSTAQVPDDLAAALSASPAAARFFETLNSVNRYAILYRIQAVKREETRAKKIRSFIEMLERGEKIHP